MEVALNDAMPHALLSSVPTFIRPFCSKLGVCVCVIASALMRLQEGPGSEHLSYLFPPLYCLAWRREKRGTCLPHGHATGCRSSFRCPLGGATNRPFRFVRRLPAHAARPQRLQEERAHCEFVSELSATVQLTLYSREVPLSRLPIYISASWVSPV